MHDQDVVARLNTIHDALDCLSELSQAEGVRASNLTSIIELIELSFDPLHEHLNRAYEQSGAVDAHVIAPAAQHIETTA